MISTYFVAKPGYMKTRWRVSESIAELNAKKWLKRMGRLPDPSAFLLAEKKACVIQLKRSVGAFVPPESVHRYV